MSQGRCRRVAFGLGSNLGNRRQNLARALEYLETVLSKARTAPIYRSRAVSHTPQADYLNTVVVGDSSLSSEALLAIAKGLELAAGRERTRERNQPRVLDVDLLLAGAEVSARPELTLPHPRLAQRAFVLQPLAEIASDWPVPPDGLTVQELLDRLVESLPNGDDSGCERLDSETTL